jgi:hypothetical protein
MFSFIQKKLLNLVLYDKITVDMDQKEKVEKTCFIQLFSLLLFPDRTDIDLFYMLSAVHQFN